MSTDPDLAALVRRIRRGDRSALARGITLVESSRPADAAAAEALLGELADGSGQARRIGISGPPGAGKSTLIDALGCVALDSGETVAVLAIDPTSGRSGGSLLGDKTRMERLGRARGAFVRPSPGGGAAGGVARRTREAIVVCEAAGFGCVIVETVGVGQSEVAVADLVDTVVLVLPPHGGDELQGLKRGITEVADVVFVNKADGAPTAAADARSRYDAALRLLRGDGVVPVLAGSALAGDGVAELWQAIAAHRDQLGADGLRRRRVEQALAWLDALVAELALARLRADRPTQERLAALRADVAAGRLAPTVAARQLLPPG